MVAVQENRTRITGTVTAVAPDAGGGPFVDLDVEVAGSEPVDGYPDLLTPNQPTDRPWVLRARAEELPETDVTGWRLQGCAALAGPGVVRLVGVDPAPVLTPPVS